MDQGAAGRRAGRPGYRSSLKPHRRRSEAVSVCVRCREANRNRMCCDLCRKCGLLVGSGGVESACKRIVENRFKKAGCRMIKKWDAPMAAAC